MFGDAYHVIESQLGKTNAFGTFDQEALAVSLLANILDRAKLLELIFLTGNPGDMTEDEIHRAIHVFREDCREARVRAYRAGLFDNAEGKGQWTETPVQDFVLSPGDEQLPIVKEFWAAKHGNRKAEDAGVTAVEK